MTRVIGLGGRVGRLELTPARLRHLEAELAAAERRLETHQFDVSNHQARQAERRWRKALNAGLRPENAMDPRWWKWFRF